jgi:hypothetical protein
MGFRLRSLVVLAAIAVCAPAPLRAEDAQKKAQNKLLSKRAAEADAYRKLAEAIKGIQINSTTYVRDFVTESDTISTDLDAFIRGIKLGQPTWYEDDSCEVPGEVTVAKIINTIKELHERHYKGDRVKATDITQMQQNIKTDVIKVVGSGAPREDLPPDLPAGVAEQVSAGGPPPAPKPALPPIWIQMGPQARLMAKRAAEIDAKRRLAERIKGLRIDSRTLVRDFVAESDTINTVCQTTLVGARVIKEYYHFDEPIVEVTVEVPTEQVITTIKELHTRYYKGDQVKATDIENVTQTIKSQTFEETGMGVPPPAAVQKYEAVAKVDVPDWAAAAIRATGQGTDPAINTPQGKLKAARAAELDAKRKLAEQVMGLQIGSQTSVKDFVTQNDDIVTRVDAVLVGSTVEKTEFAGDTAQVTVMLPGMEVWTVIHQKTVVRLK